MELQTHTHYKYVWSEHRGDCPCLRLHACKGLGPVSIGITGFVLGCRGVRLHAWCKQATYLYGLETACMMLRLRVFISLMGFNVSGFQNACMMQEFGVNSGLK